MWSAGSDVCKRQGNIDAGCGCGVAGPSGCDDNCGSTAGLDEGGESGGEAIAAGACDCDGNIDAGCGCGVAGPSGCDDACGSTAELDECGECGGNGIADGACDCDGNVDAGCGCGVAGPSGCDDGCGSPAEVDECGVCGGDGNSCSIDVLLDLALPADQFPPEEMLDETTPLRRSFEAQMAADVGAALGVRADRVEISDVSIAGSAASWIDKRMKAAPDGAAS